MGFSITRQSLALSIVIIASKNKKGIASSLILSFLCSLFTIGCNSVPSANNVKVESIKILTRKFSELGKIKINDIQVLSIDSDVSISSIEAMVLLSGITKKGISKDIYLKLSQGNQITNWAITAYGEKINGEIKYHGLYPFLDLEVIDAREHLNISDETYE